MLNYELKRSRGFHPRRCGSPDAITPATVLRHHRSAQGRHGGTGSCPLFHSYQHPEFHIKGKGILQSQKMKKTGVFSFLTELAGACLIIIEGRSFFSFTEIGKKPEHSRCFPGRYGCPPNTIQPVQEIRPCRVKLRVAEEGDLYVLPFPRISPGIP